MRAFRCTSIVALLSILLTTLSCWARVWDVNELGAQGDKRTNDTMVIQKAIDNAAQAGGGTVYVPAGDYRCGQLQLRSHVTLHLESGATLWVSPDKADYYRGSTFLLAQDQNDIAIEGRGTIHGTGQEDLQRKRGDKRPRPDWRVGILRFTGCTNVALRDIIVRYSDSWTLDLERCEDVVIDGVRILNNYYRVNADGIDPVSCRRVRISNCFIVAGDDCIVCKTREGHPCEDIVVTNCVLESIATAGKIGTESPSDFRNILVSNCVIRNSTIGLGLFLKDGGKTEKTEDRRETIFARQSSYVTLANIDGLTVNGLRVLIPDEVFAKYNRAALSLHSVSKATLTDLRREPPEADSTVPVVMLENCRNALLTGCLAPPNTGIFLGLAGKETADICLKANDLTAAPRAVYTSGEVPKEAVRD